MEEILRDQRRYYLSGKTREPAQRIEDLKRLQQVLRRQDSVLLRALHADLGKSQEEAYMMELGFVLGELSHAIRHLRRWSRGQVKLPSIAQLPGYGRVIRDPYGVVLVLAPWNYPLQLTLAPLIAAVAAGNCVVARPSSSAPHTAQALAAVIEEAFVPEHVTCLLGDSQAAGELTALPFDKIFFTGSPAVGRQVMRAAADNLVPVTLELGGKSPAIVTADADIKLAARRIVWGKFINAGQTCIAPDYVLAASQVENALLDAMRAEVERQFGKDPIGNPDLGAIISDRHFNRLADLLGGGRLICGGQIDPDSRRIAPTILSGIVDDDPLMQEEIFGPILPVQTFNTMQEAYRKVRARPKPLALYLFTTDRTAARRFMRDMAYGGGCVNDTLLHIANTRMPFGGVGNSGMGSYHGKYGFECFTRPKGILEASTRIDVPVRYPPWEGKMNLLRKIMK